MMAFIIHRKYDGFCIHGKCKYVAVFKLCSTFVHKRMLQTWDSSSRTDHIDFFFSFHNCPCCSILLTFHVIGYFAKEYPYLISVANSQY